VFHKYITDLIIVLIIGLCILELVFPIAIFFFPYSILTSNWKHIVVKHMYSNSNGLQLAKVSILGKKDPY
jgi:hypothetical protein